MAQIPDMLSKNEFLLDQTGMELTDDENQLQHELLTSPMFRPHKAEEGSDDNITAEFDTHSLIDFAR